MMLMILFGDAVVVAVAVHTLFGTIPTSFVILRTRTKKTPAFIES